MRSGLAAHRSSVRRQQFARELHARRVACAHCHAWFLTEDATKTHCSRWCVEQTQKETAR